MEKRAIAPLLAGSLACDSAHVRLPVVWIKLFFFFFLCHVLRMVCVLCMYWYMYFPLSVCFVDLDLANESRSICMSEASTVVIVYTKWIFLLLLINFSLNFYIWHEYISCCFSKFQLKTITKFHAAVLRELVLFLKMDISVERVNAIRMGKDNTIILQRCEIKKLYHLIVDVCE